MDGLIQIIEQIHIDCYMLCKQSVGKTLSNAGNIGIFCKSDEEYERWTKLREEITAPSDNPNQKYFRLKEPIVFSEATYEYLYIRKPDPTPYGRYLGDVDFYLSPDEYLKLKKNVITGLVNGAQVYDRPGWDMIQLSDPSIKSVAYVSTKEMAEKARVKQSEND